MPETIDLNLEYLKRLPRRDDSWQLGIERMPQWVVEEGKPPVRPLMPLCRSARTGALGGGELLAPGESLEAAAIRAVTNFSRVKNIAYLPQRLELRDRNIADALRPLLEDLGIEVLVIPRLDLIDEVLDKMAHDFLDEFALQSAFAPEVKLDQIRSFAEAAKLFYESAPWNHLDSHDLIHILSKVPDPGLEWFTVLGAGGQEYGLSFNLSPQEHEEVLAGKIPETFHTTSHWLLSFERIHHLALPDADLWEEHALPVAGPEAYPLLIHAQPSSPVRPVRGTGSWARRESRLSSPANAEELVFFEILLRLLAQTTEDELDLGKWSDVVMTHRGGRKVALAIPAMLKSPLPPKTPPPFDRRIMDRTLREMEKLIADREFESVEEMNAYVNANINRKPPAPTTPEDKAQDLFYQALDVVGRGRIKLAREALRLWPDCADAWILLAEEMPDLTRRMELYGKALESAKRTLDPTLFEEAVGKFWGIVETRPYMRALLGLAEDMWLLGRHELALRTWRELLRLNEEDNQGVRYVLLPRLIALGRDAEALELLDSFEDDPTALPAYARALLEFRRQGAGIASDNYLRAAMRSNPHVVKFLLGNAELPEDLPHGYQIGSEDEAILAALELREPWAATPRAVDWLRGARREKKKARARGRSKKK